MARPGQNSAVVHFQYGIETALKNTTTSPQLRQDLQEATKELGRDPALRDPANSKMKGYLGPLSQADADRYIAALHGMAGVSAGAGYRPEQNLNPFITAVQARTAEPQVKENQLYDNQGSPAIARARANLLKGKIFESKGPTTKFNLNGDLASQAINAAIKLGTANAGKIVGAGRTAMNGVEVVDKNPLSLEDIDRLGVALSARHGVSKEVAGDAIGTIRALEVYSTSSDKKRIAALEGRVLSNLKEDTPAGPSQEHGKISKPSPQAPAATPDAAQPPAAAKPEAAAPDCGVVDMGALLSGNLGDTLKKPDPNCKPARNSGPVLGGD